MAVKAMRLGQIWRNDENGQNFLVTKLYSEVFSLWAILRPAETDTTLESRRIKVLKSNDGVALPGYTFTQDSNEEF